MIRCLLLLLFLSLLIPTPSLASMSNDNYNIEMDGFNMFSGKMKNEKNKLDAKGKTNPEVFTGPNYTIRPLMTPNHSLASFSFSITGEFIDFGLLSATNPVTRTSDLTVLSPGSGYQVLVYEEHPLRSKEGSVIPDTTCDNGSCNEVTAAPWTSSLTYGFGYRCDNTRGNDCNPDFVTDYYKQFADNSQKEPWQMIMGSRSPQKESEAKVTYRVNIAGAQRTGSYANDIVFIATPGY